MMKTRKRLLIAATALTTFYLFLWLGAPPLVRSLAQSKLGETLGRPVAIREVTLNPFSLELEIKGVEVREPDGKAVFFAFDRLYMNMEISSLFRRALVLKALTLDKPTVNLARNEDSSYNFSDLLKGGKNTGRAEEAKQTQEPTEPARFFLGNITVVGGNVTLDNKPAQSRHEVAEIGLFLPVLSNLPVFVEEFAKPRLAFVFDGSAVNLEGRTKPFADSHETEFDVKVDDLDLVKYLPYSPVEFGFDVKSARASLALVINYVQKREGAPSLVVGGSATLSGVELIEKSGGELLGFEKAQALLAPSDLLAGKLEIASFTVEAPHARIERNAAGEINLAVLGRFKPKGAPAPLKEDGGNAEVAAAEGMPFDLAIRKVKVGSGRIAFTDATNRTPFAFALSGLNLEASDITLADSSLGGAALTFEGDGGEKFSARCAGKWQPPMLTGAVTLDNLALRRFLPYYADALPVEIAGGRVSSVGAEWEWRGGGDATVKEAFLGLEALTVAKKSGGEPFLRLKGLNVQGAGGELRAKTANLGRIALTAPVLAVVRDASGKIDLALLGGKDGSAPGAANEPSAAADEAAPTEGEKWQWSLEALKLAGGEATFTDETTAPPAAHSLTALNIDVAALSSQPLTTSKLNLAAIINRNGKLKADGQVGVNPPAANLTVALAGLDLPAVNPYLAGGYNIALASGQLALNGAAAFSAPGGAPASWSFDGASDITSLRLVDPATSEDVVRLGSLTLANVSVSSAPLKVAVGAVAVTDPYARIDLSPEGVMNLSGLKKKATGEGEAARAEPPGKGEDSDTTIEVGDLTLSGGVLDFSDRHIKPGYRAKVGNLNGRVSRMSSLATEGGEASIIGSVDGYAPLEITGRVNPFAKDLFVDLKVAFRNVEMSPFTPYSSRYLGYAIAKGKLGIALQYKIVGKKLDSENQVVIDQLTLGDRTPNPDEISIPVRFALALLTDRKGVIDLTVPVSGTLDDPEFSWGRIIWKVIGNVLVKAVTSPFALLGSLFGDGADLSVATFDPGRDALKPEAQATLDKLAKALEERPALKLDITGRADPALDRDALRAEGFMRKLKSAKLKRLLAAKAAPLTAPAPSTPVSQSSVPLVAAPEKEEPLPELDAVVVTGEERAGLIVAAFDDEKLPRPPVGARPLTGEEMEKLLITSVNVGEDDLRALAARRARAAQDYLVGVGRADPARLFIVENSGAEDKEEGSAAKVEFNLK